MRGDLGRNDLLDSGGHILTVVWPSSLSVLEDGALGKPRGKSGCGRPNNGPWWNKEVHLQMQEAYERALLSRKGN